MQVMRFEKSACPNGPFGKWYTHYAGLLLLRIVILIVYQNISNSTILKIATGEN